MPSASSTKNRSVLHGPVVQLVERLTGSQEVVGSRPICVHHVVKLGSYKILHAEMIGTDVTEQTTGLKGTVVRERPCGRTGDIRRQANPPRSPKTTYSTREGRCNVRSDKYYSSERGLTMDVCYFYRDGTEVGKTEQIQ